MSKYIKLSQEEQNKILHSDFDIATHKKCFINYLEVVITSDGVIHYAVPSHQQFVVNLLLSKGYTYDQIYEMPDIYSVAKCCAVWTNHVTGYVNNAILQKLHELIENNLLWFYI